MQTTQTQESIEASFDSSIKIESNSNRSHFITKKKSLVREQKIDETLFVVI